MAQSVASRRISLPRALVVCASVFLLLSCGGSHDQNQGTTAEQAIQIKGSDTMVNLVETWAERFVEGSRSANISITGGGSGTGFAALLNKTCDIAMASRSIEDKERASAKKNGIFPVEYIVGLDGLVVIVNKDNPVKGLTLDELRDIYMGTVRNWKDAGGDDSRIVILSRESNSGTHIFFKEHVLKRGNKRGTEEFSPHALLMPSSQAIVNEVSQNPHAVGYVGIGYRSPALKAVPLALAAGQPYIEANVRNVLDDLYPISRPLYLYTDGEPQGVIKAFIEFALSPDGQKMVEELDFVPMRQK